MSRPVPSTIPALAAILVLPAALGACASGRFDGPGARTSRPQVALDQTVPSVPSGAVTRAPHAPPPGVAEAPPPPGGAGVGAGVVAAAPPIVVEPPPAPPPPPVVATGRSAVVGAWTATDASGSCRVSLSSAPALDLYKATTSGCGNRDLSKVSAWDFRDGEVYLYQPGGTVTARLRQAGGSLDGALSKSGATLSLAR